MHTSNAFYIFSYFELPKTRNLFMSVRFYNVFRIPYIWLLGLFFGRSKSWIYGWAIFCIRLTLYIFSHFELPKTPTLLISERFYSVFLIPYNRLLGLPFGRPRATLTFALKPPPESKYCIFCVTCYKVLDRFYNFFDFLIIGYLDYLLENRKARLMGKQLFANV